MMKLLKVVRKKDGMTLVEVIVGLALMSILVLIFTTFIFYSMAAMSRNIGLKSADTNAVAGVENAAAGVESSIPQTVTSESSSTFIVTFGSTTITTNGELVEGTDTQAKSKYSYFVPN
jgi:prepilin-type N-terminal cleavage/methylation domain-containing protein